MNPIACPSLERLCAFALGELPETELDAVAEHLDACTRCEEQAGQLDRADDPIVVGLRLIGDSGLGTLIVDGETEVSVETTDVSAVAETWGDFRIVREIGRGGMGIVYEAYQGSLNRHVALKSLHARGDLARFRREAKAAGRLHHTNIVPVHGVGEHAGRHYYIMQFIAGRGLDEAWRERRRCGEGRGAAAIAADFRAAARVGLQAAGALAYAHEQGVIHRDIKPSNLLIDGQDVVWITDFGLAFDAAETETLTHTGDTLGTLRYMAPERFDGRGDARADVYGLGITLYELICGRPAFPDAQRAALIHRVMHQDPPRLREVDPRVPRDLETIVLKAMARDPSHRYATAAGLAEDLRRFLEDRPILARPAGAWKQGVRWCRRNPGISGLVGGIALALLLGTVVASYFAIRATRSEGRARRNETMALANAHRADREARRAREEKQLSDRRLYVAEMHLAQQAWQDNRPDLVEEHLREFVPARADDPDPRGFEWYYLRRLCQVGPRTLLGHADRVTGVAYSPDGRTLATGSADGAVVLWEPTTGRMVRTLLGHSTGEIDALAFRPDGGRVVSAGGDGTARLWDTATGQALLTLRGHADRVTGVAYAPDGRRIASCGQDGTVRLWDAATGRALRTLRGHTSGVYSVAFSPDGATLATASSDHTVKLWDAATGRALHTLRGHSDVARCVAFSPDGRTVASASWDQTIKLWDAASAQEIRTLRGSTGPLTGVMFGPDGRTIASSAWDGAVRLWDAGTGQEVRTLRGHARSEINAVAYSPDGRHLASVGWDRMVKLWDAATTDPEARTLRGHSDVVADLAFSPDGRTVASAGVDRSVRLWDAASGREVCVLRGHTGAVLGVAFAPDGRMLASAGALGSVRLWDAASGQAIRSLHGHAAEVASVAFSPDSRWVASGGADGTIRLWDVASGRAIRDLRGHTDGVLRLTFSPDGRTVASAGVDRSVRLWDAASGREVRTLHIEPPCEVRGVAFSPDGRTLASACCDQTIRLWDVVAGREVRSLHGHAAEVDAVVFSPDGRRLVSASEDRTVKLWDVDTGQEVVCLRGHADQVVGVAFSPDGLTLASASGDQTIKLWDASPLTPELQVLGEARGVVEFLFGRSANTGDVLDRIRSDATLTPEIRRRTLELAGPYGESLVTREAERRVESLYNQAMLRPDLVASLRTDPSMSEPVRRRALALAEQIPESPERLNTASWAVVCQPDADPAARRLALRQAEAACRLAPDNIKFLATLGWAQYRTGHYRDAEGTLLKRHRLDANLRAIPGAEDLALLAMCQYKCGRNGEARSTMSRLREALRTPSDAQSQQGRGYLGEAETLELDLIFPDDPFAP
jgi:WD40 repeat protein